MDTTSISLLRRLQSPSPEKVAWERFVELYTPLIFYWGRNRGLRESDAKDVVQEVLAVMVREIPNFQYSPKRRFRGWLRTITVNKAIDLHRRNEAKNCVLDSDLAQRLTVESETDVFAEAQYRAFLVQRMRKLIEKEFEPKTWQACWKVITESKTAADVGRELGLSANAVRLAKLRVLRRLRQELDGLLD